MMAFILGCLVGAAVVLTIVGLTFLIKYDAYHKGYLDGLYDGTRPDQETKIYQWKDEDDGK